MGWPPRAGAGGVNTGRRLPDRQAAPSSYSAMRSMMIAGAMPPAAHMVTRP